VKIAHKRVITAIDFVTSIIAVSWVTAITGHPSCLKFFVTFLMAVLECRLGYLANAGLLYICLFPLHPHMKLICYRCGWRGVVGPLVCRPVSPHMVLVRNTKQWECSFRANLRFLSTKAHCARICGFLSQLTL
jgi:hypothetical protein